MLVEIFYNNDLRIFSPKIVEHLQLAQIFHHEQHHLQRHCQRYFYSSQCTRSSTQIRIIAILDRVSLRYLSDLVGFV